MYGLVFKRNRGSVKAAVLLKGKIDELDIAVELNVSLQIANEKWSLKMGKKLEGTELKSRQQESQSTYM